MKKVIVIDSCKTLWSFYRKELINNSRIVMTIPYQNNPLLLLEVEKPDIIIMDNMLSADKQKFLFKRIRHAFNETPVILHTFGSGNTASINDLFLAKSSSLSELRYITDTLLETQGSFTAERGFAGAC